jgi:lysophospholipase L1-like esterase
VADQPLQICIVGDELVAGAGDPRGIGWVGRVAAQSVADPMPTFFTLAAPSETSAQLAQRWQDEVERRFLPGCDYRLVVAPGTADLEAGVSTARSRLNLAIVLDGAMRHHYSLLVIGPPPGPAATNRAVDALSRAFGEVARRRNIPYVDTFTPLVAHEQYLADLAMGDGRHPGQAGYGLIAWLVLHAGWHRWLGIPEPVIPD